MKDAQALEAGRELSSPWSRAKALTLTGDVDLVAVLGRPASGIYVGGDGDIHVKYLSLVPGQTAAEWVPHIAAKAGSYLVGTFVAVRASGAGQTTATNLVAGAS